MSAHRSKQISDPPRQDIFAGAIRFAKTKDYVAVLACAFLFTMTAIVTSDDVYDKEIAIHPTGLALEKYASELPPHEAALLARWAARSTTPYNGAGADGVMTVREALDEQSLYERRNAPLGLPRLPTRP